MIKKLLLVCVLCIGLVTGVVLLAKSIFGGKSQDSHAHMQMGKSLVLGDTGSFEVDNVDDLLKGYYQGTEAMANDQLDKAKAGFSEFHNALHSIKDPAARVYADKIKDILHGVTEAKDLSAIRAKLQPLSYAVYDFLKNNKTKAIDVHAYMCPMVGDVGSKANASQGYWLSRKANVENPYMGQKMFSCGSAVTEIPQ